MEWNWKEYRKKKHQFKSYYCEGCKQRKPCRLLWNSDWQYCCQCHYELEQNNWADYLTYVKSLSYEKEQQKDHQKDLRQLQLGTTPEEERKFASWKKFYQQKSWGIDLGEWLNSKRVLPVDYHCAEKWRRDNKHLPESCDCLERKAQENFLYFTNCLQEDKEKLEQACKCETSPKIRVDSDYSTECESCGGTISVASKKRVIRNRNDPRFWGLEVEEKVLCGACLEAKKSEMLPLRRAEFNRYRKIGRL